MSGSPWGIPLILLSGGILGIILGDGSKRLNLKIISWRILFSVGNFPIVCVGITSTCWILMHFSQVTHLLPLFERFYRYGYLVFGGGQVVVSVSAGRELVDQTGLLTAGRISLRFRFGSGLFPGPMVFSFAAFAGGLSENHGEITRQILGALIGGLAIFLPGTLLLFAFILFGRNSESYLGSSSLV